MEHNKPHITPEFEDHAWTEMRRLLDLEMPVLPERRRRPVFWWLVLTGIGLAVVLGSLWWKNQQDKPLPEPEPIPAVAENRGSQDSDISETTLAEVNTLGITPSEITPPLIPQKSSQKLLKPKLTPTQELLPRPAPPETIVAIPQQPFVESTVENPQTSQSGRMVALSNLPQLSLSDFDTFDKPILSVFAPNSKPNRAPGLSLVLSGFTNPRGRGDGLAAGLQFHYPKQNSRLRLEVAAKYAYIRQPLSILVPAKAGTFGPVTAGTAGSVILSFADLDQQANSLNRNYLLANQDLGLHYLDIPFGLSLKLMKKLRLHTGFNVGVLVFSAPDFTRGSLFSANSKTFSLDSDPMEKSSAAAASFSVPLNRYNVSLLSGLHYQLSARTGIRFGYKLGLTDLIESNTETDHTRLLQLSAVYRLR